MLQLLKSFNFPIFIFASTFRPTSPFISSSITSTFYTCTLLMIQVGNALPPPLETTVWEHTHRQFSKWANLPGLSKNSTSRSKLPPGRIFVLFTFETLFIEWLFLQNFPNLSRLVFSFSPATPKPHSRLRPPIQPNFRGRGGDKLKFGGLSISILN